jgi:lysophospholipase
MRNQAIYGEHPELALGGPTVAWVHAACEAMETLQDPYLLARIHIPLLIIAAGADEVVSTPAIERLARRIPSGSIVTIDGAQHELLQEADIYREQMLAAFDAFVPGSDAPLGV